MRKVAGFLNKDVPDDLMRGIADKCSFKNLKHATETYKQPWDLTSKLSPEEQEMIAKWKKQETQFYRKGNNIVRKSASRKIICATPQSVQRLCRLSCSKSQESR